MLRLLPGISLLLISTLPVHSSAFSKTCPEFFLCYLWLTPVSVRARRMKEVTLLSVELMKVPVLSACGIYIGSETRIIVLYFLGLCPEIVE